VLRRISGPKRYEVIGEWRKLHNEKPNYLYYSSNIVQVIRWRIMRWAGHVTHLVERKCVYMVLVGKPEGKRPFGRPRRRWEDNIKIDLQEVVRWPALDRPGSGQGQVAGTCECGSKPSASVKWEEFLD